MNNEYELYHYGVKGMKWGVRRARPSTIKEHIRDAKDSYDMYKKDGNVKKAYGTYRQKRIASKIDRIKRDNVKQKEYINLYKQDIRDAQKQIREHSKKAASLHGKQKFTNDDFKILNKLTDEIDELGASVRIWDEEIEYEKNIISNNNMQISQLKDEYKTIGRNYIKSAKKKKK